MYIPEEVAVGFHEGKRIPVSYTHLDVYKRQVHVKVYSEKIVILYGKEKVVSHQRSYCGGDWCIKLEHYLRTPVSYTHLDVYKRQELTS